MKNKKDKFWIDLEDLRNLKNSWVYIKITIEFNHFKS